MPGKAQGKQTAVKPLRREGKSAGSSLDGAARQWRGESLILDRGEHNGESPGKMKNCQRKSKSAESLGKRGNCQRIEVWRNSSIRQGWW